MISVDLFGDGENLWPELAVALVDLDVVDGEYRFQSEFNLGPDEQFLERF